MPERMSVLMPVLNEESSICTAVTSVLSQEGCAPEVLVVDGRSADGTRAAVGELIAAGAPVRLLDNPAVIIPSALNVALAASHTKYVARVDGHAEISPDYLARAIGHLDADPSLAGVGGRRHGVARTRVGRAIAAVMSSRFGVGNSINHYATDYQLTDHASFGVYRREAALEVGGWDENLPVNEDVDFDHRLALAGFRIAYDPDMVIHWHVRESVTALFRQYRRYGRGKAAMVRKNGRDAVRLRHLAPPTLVVLTSLALLVSPVWPSSLLFLILYLAGAVAIGAVTWCGLDDRRNTSLIAMPGAFVATHFGWGLGFLEGLVLGRAPAVASGSTRTSAAVDLPS